MSVHKRIYSVAVWHNPFPIMYISFICAFSFEEFKKCSFDILIRFDRLRLGFFLCIRPKHSRNARYTFSYGIIFPTFLTAIHYYHQSFLLFPTSLRPKVGGDELRGHAYVPNLFRYRSGTASDSFFFILTPE